METAFDEFKTHLRGGQRVLRSKTPDLVRQEAQGFLLAHFAIRALMHEAALGALLRARDPDTLSFTHAQRVTCRTLPPVAALPPQDQPRQLRACQLWLDELRVERVSSSWGRVVPRGVKRKMSNFPLRPRRRVPTRRRQFRIHIVRRRCHTLAWDNPHRTTI